MLRAVAGVAVAFATVLPAAWWLRPRVPGISDDAFGVITALILVTVAMALGGAIRPRWPTRRRVRHGTPVDSPPPPEPCTHIRAFEAELRVAGIAVPEHSRAACRIDEARLARAWPRMVYRESYYPERSPRDNPYAIVACADCPSAKPLEVLHPDQGPPDAPVFPAA